jgi:hypothetical protein
MQAIDFNPETLTQPIQDTLIFETEMLWSSLSLPSTYFIPKGWPLSQSGWSATNMLIMLIFRLNWKKDSNF